MKAILCILFISLKIACFAQPIQYRPYLKSSCTGTFRVMDNYSLKKDSLTFYSLNTGNTITLPDTGTYILESPQIPNSLSTKIPVHIKNRGFNSDTLKAVDIGEVLFIDSKPPKGMFNGVWLCCSKVCNGYKTEYYTSGGKYFEGKFKKGKPVGRFTYYYESGRISATIQYNHRGKPISLERFKDS